MIIFLVVNNYNTYKECEPPNIPDRRFWNTRMRKNENQLTPVGMWLIPSIEGKKNIHYRKNSFQTSPPHT